MKRWLLLVALGLIWFSGKSQNDISVLTNQDQAQLKAIQEKVQPSAEVFEKICGHYLTCHNKQISINTRMDELSSESTSTALEELNKLSAEKKSLKEDRDLSVEMELTPEQRDIYLSQIKIAKPQVLHFGQTHDRMNCPVCVPKP